jgi:hypothetical protein
MIRNEPDTPFQKRFHLASFHAASSRFFVSGINHEYRARSY